MQVVRILKVLRKHYNIEPLEDELPQEDVFRILISTILSQNCSDANSEKAARQLFKKYRTPEQIAGATLKEIEKLIVPSGFYKVKARRLKEVSRIILKKYEGKVPRSLDELVKLPGVGRKTAGCVMVYGFSEAESIPVDTHVHRIANRLGLVETKSRKKTEQELMKMVPRKHWLLVNESFVLHGKNICTSRKPKCSECPINKYCKYYHNIYEGGKGRIGNHRKTMLKRMRND